MRGVQEIQFTRGCKLRIGGTIRFQPEERLAPTVEFSAWKVCGA